LIHFYKRYFNDGLEIVVNFSSNFDESISD